MWRKSKESPVIKSTSKSKVVLVLTRLIYLRSLSGEYRLLLLLSSLSHRNSLDSLIRPTTAHSQSARYVNRLGVLITVIVAFVRSIGCENPALDYHSPPQIIPNLFENCRTDIMTFHSPCSCRVWQCEYSWIDDKMEKLCTISQQLAVNIQCLPPRPHPTPFFWGSTALMGLGLLIVGVSRSHSDTPLSVGILWMNDRPVAETCTWQLTKITRDRHPCPQLSSNPQRPPGSNACRSDSKHVNCFTLQNYLPDSLLSFCCRKQIGLHCVNRTNGNFYTWQQIFYCHLRVGVRCLCIINDVCCGDMETSYS
jgi:hypothetical protein